MVLSRIVKVLLFLVVGAELAHAQEREIVVQFSEREAQIAIQLFDYATKAQGLSVAEAALVLSKKLHDASNKKPEAQKK